MKRNMLFQSVALMLSLAGFAPANALIPVDPIVWYVSLAEEQINANATARIVDKTNDGIANGDFFGNPMANTTKLSRWSVSVHSNDYYGEAVVDPAVMGGHIGVFGTNGSGGGGVGDTIYRIHSANPGVVLHYVVNYNAIFCDIYVGGNCAPAQFGGVDFEGKIFYPHFGIQGFGGSIDFTKSPCVPEVAVCRFEQFIPLLEIPTEIRWGLGLSTESELPGGLNPQFHAAGANVGLELLGTSPVGWSSQSAVPEPASWSMLITGFGLVGGLARRRRHRGAAAAVCVA